MSFLSFCLVICLSFQPQVYPQATWCGFRRGTMFLYPGIQWKQGTMSQKSLGTRSVSHRYRGCKVKHNITAHVWCCCFFVFFHCRYYCVKRDGATAKSWELQTQPWSWRFLRGAHTSSRCAQSVKEVKEPPALRSECSPPQVSIHCVVFQMWGFGHMTLGLTA